MVKRGNHRPAFNSAYEQTGTWIVLDFVFTLSIRTGCIFFLQIYWSFVLLLEFVCSFFWLDCLLFFFYICKNSPCFICTVQSVSPPGIIAHLHLGWSEETWHSVPQAPWTHSRCSMTTCALTIQLVNTQHEHGHHHREFHCPAGLDCNPILFVEIAFLHSFFTVEYLFCHTEEIIFWKKSYLLI